MRRIVALMAPVAAVVLGGLWLWHARAVAQSQCIYQCVPNQVCYGSSEVQCWGCAPGSMNYNCENQMGRKEWLNSPTYGSSNTGTQSVQYESVRCWWRVPCASTWFREYSCNSFWGVCTKDPPSHEGCSQCRIAEGAFKDIHYYLNARCSNCPSGG